MTRIALPALLTLVLVAGLLATSGWNRAGTPIQVVTLTERELWLETPPPAVTGDEPGLRLRLAFESRADALDSRAWLTDVALQQLGFSLDIPVGSPQAAYTYDHVPARLGWVAFEYDGPAFRDIDRRRTLQNEGTVWRGRRAPSRLVPVDAGPDPDVLRTRYGSTHLVMRAAFGLRYQASAGGGPVRYGWVRETVPASVSVPVRFRDVLEGIVPDAPAVDHREPEQPPRYEVDLAIGRLGLPYVIAVRPLQPAAAR